MTIPFLYKRYAPSAMLSACPVESAGYSTGALCAMFTPPALWNCIVHYIPLGLNDPVQYLTGACPVKSCLLLFNWGHQRPRTLIMKNVSHVIPFCILFAVFCLILPNNAHAYLDPGTGSYIFQLIIAAFIGGLFSIKLFWNKIKMFLKKLLSIGDKHE